MRTIFISLVFGALPLACHNTEPAYDDAMVSADAAPADKIQPAALSVPPGMAKNADENAATVGQKIIKEATLRFETGDIEKSYAQIMSAVKTHGAEVQNDVEGKDYSSIFRNITIRIPNRRFDLFLADVGKDVAYFDRREISARDVTEEYIDLDARLKAKKVLESRYLELLKKANKVSEILEIERELAAVREEIESKEGQLKYLQNHVAMSTVSIEFYKKTDVQAGITVSYGSKMWNAIKSGFNGISAFFIGLLYLWPLILILVALFFFVRRKIRNRKIM